MRSRNFLIQALVFAAVWLGSPSLVQAAYQAPRLDQALLARDGLSLDLDAMSSLSKAIMDMAGAPNGWTPQAQRVHAQMVALALFLDPNNQTAKLQNRLMQEGKPPVPVDERSRLAARNRVWQNIRWLSSAEAGASSKLLATYLSDIMVYFDPEHPLVAKRDPAGEAGRWQAVVAPLEAFAGEGEKESLAGDDEDIRNPFEKTPSGEEVQADQADTAEEKSEAIVRLKGPLTVRGVGRLYDNKRRNTYPSLIAFQLRGKSWEDRKKKEFKLHVDPWVDDKSKRLSKNVERALRERFDKFPHCVDVRVKTEFPLSEGRVTLDSVELPILLGIEGLMRGEAPREACISFGRVAWDQAVSGEGHWWNLSQVLREKLPESSVVLLIPDDVADAFINIIALNEPEFFVTYQCFRIKSADEAVPFLYGEPEPSVLKAKELFSDIQRVVETKNINVLASNSHVRDRLMQVLKADPRHLSARMLLVQGSGKRPSKVSGEVLAYECRGVLNQVKPLLTENPRNSKRGEGLMETWSRLREETDLLARYVDKDEREFYQETIDVIDYLRTLDRHARKGDSGRHDLKETVRQGRRACAALESKVRRLLGERDPNAVIKPE